MSNNFRRRWIYMTLKKLTDISSEIGFLMLSHGAEIHRVEDTICRIAAAYGIAADVFAIPTSLVVTLSDSEGKSFTTTRRVYSRDMNLDIVDKLNELSRKICKTKPEFNEILAAVNTVKERPTYHPLFIYAIAALGAGAFAILFDGDIYDSFAAAAVGILIRLATDIMDRSNGGALLTNIVGGAVCSAASLILFKLYPTLNFDVVIISSLMLLVPGLSMTNSVRDLIAGDLNAGVLKAAEATLIATGVALGVMLSLTTVRPFLGV